MTASHTATSSVQRDQLGTLSVLAWSGDPETNNLPYLLAYSLGDGKDGAEAGEAAVRTLFDELGIPLGSSLADGSRPGFPVRLLVEGGQAAVNMPYLSAQCPVPAEWLQAVADRGEVHFMFASKPWPEAVPGRPVSEEVLSAFVGDEAMLTTSAHCMLPVTQLRK
ncbi:hypothetical protein G3I19_15500 [Streptomyces sp. SID10853]|uniref:DUF5949 family protein n=1 Tax=Streptomyces sp. SID10853 TaxID=2706028 RepID=UPI0013C1AE8C|nr:DUF5949 family protein [Streptomyces sp. SID10853]NDZ79891.1 hypothetical protein [Streptomyces sp. SID10853]